MLVCAFEKPSPESLWLANQTRDFVRTGVSAPGRQTGMPERLPVRLSQHGPAAACPQSHRVSGRMHGALPWSGFLVDMSQKRAQPWGGDMAVP